MARRPVTPDLSWITRLRDEVATLPETLRAFRETVEDLRTVAKRLEVLTELMERTQAHLDALGVTDTARQLDDAVVAVEKQLSARRGSIPGGAGGALGVPSARGGSGTPPVELMHCGGDAVEVVRRLTELLAERRGLWLKVAGGSKGAALAAAAAPGEDWARGERRDYTPHRPAE